MPFFFFYFFRYICWKYQVHKLAVEFRCEKIIFLALLFWGKIYFHLLGSSLRTSKSWKQSRRKPIGSRHRTLQISLTLFSVSFPQVSCVCVYFLYFFILFFFFGCPVAYGIPKPGISPSRSSDLHWSCSNFLLTHCVGMRTELLSWCY